MLADKEDFKVQRYSAIVEEIFAFPLPCYDLIYTAMTGLMVDFWWPTWPLFTLLNRNIKSYICCERIYIDVRFNSSLHVHLVSTSFDFDA